MKKIDMSDKAITLRLKQTDQLRELSISLMKAKRVEIVVPKNEKAEIKKQSESPKV